VTEDRAAELAGEALPAVAATDAVELELLD
jgi:hypothetical protein